MNNCAIRAKVPVWCVSTNPSLKAGVSGWSLRYGREEVLHLKRPSTHFRYIGKF
jgi:hypothetical protein